MVEFAGDSPGLFQPGACDPVDRTVPQVGESTRIGPEWAANRGERDRATLRQIAAITGANRERAPLRRGEQREQALNEPPNYCGICGAEVWPLKGTDVLTCRRGHHQPNYWKSTV